MSTGLIVLVLLLLGLLVLRVPVAFALALSSLAYLVFISPLPTEILVQRAVAGVDSFPLLAIPLFLLAGNLMNAGGMTKRMVDFAMSLIGRYRGGLAQVNVGSSMLMSGVSGAAVADASALGSIMIPSMRAAGYDRHFSAAVTASSAVVGPIIPPSIPMIVYAAAASLSVGGMFLAGAIPGVLLGVALATTTYFLSRTRDFPTVAGFSWSEVLRRSLSALIALVMPGIIVGGIITGAFTPTESAAIAAVYAFICGKWIFRELRWSALPKIFMETAIGSSVILIIVATASAFGWMLTVERAPAQLLRLLDPFLETNWLLLLIISLVLLVLGMFMESLAIIVLVTPILLPVTLAAGIDPIHFGAFMVLNLMIGTITPPIGVVMFIVTRIADSTVTEFVRANAPYYVALFAVLLLVIFFPFLSTWLPRTAL
jgi:tripartite ATP-independent transporter DctM subunit